VFTHQLAIQTPRATTIIKVGQGLVPAVGNELLGTLGPDALSRAVLVTDATVGALYADTVSDSLRGGGITPLRFDIEPGEGSKSLDNASRLYRFLSDNRIARDGVIIALGGGVVSDLAGFVAGTWMRGVRWVVCPTTLESQIDAAIGGKTAVNIPGAKNLVGAFHHPALVLMDPGCLKTLPDRDFRAGLAESVKHAAVFSTEFFEWHERSAAAIAAREPAAVQELIEWNVRIKAGVIERDPYERTGERMLLNFGHTIGHAIEQAVNFELRHGECVAIGMLAAAHLSRSVGLGEPAIDRLRALLDRLGLPTGLRQRAPFNKIMSAIQRDKKGVAGTTRFVLLEDLARPVIRPDIPEDLIRQAHESVT
jgi:3-dehydroquinate synthase